MRFVIHYICCVCIVLYGPEYLGDGDANRRESLHYGSAMSQNKLLPFGGDIFRCHQTWRQERDSGGPLVSSQTPIFAL